MGKVVAQAIMSLDGYVAKQDNTIGRLFDWLQNGEVEIPTPAGDFDVHLSPASAEHWQRWASSIGALVCGRTLFEFVRAAECLDVVERMVIADVLQRIRNALDQVFLLDDGHG